MSVQATVICDVCHEAIEPETKRVEIISVEYSEPVGGRYLIPQHRELHLHWKCFESNLRETLHAADSP
jgi:hypothetical protein